MVCTEMAKGRFSVENKESILDFFGLRYPLDISGDVK